MALRDRILGMLPENLQVKILQRVAERNALKAFHDMAQNSPAYQDFLRQQRVDPLAVRTIEDFRQLVPPTTPENFIRVYDVVDRYSFPLERVDLFISSSGTTGEPKAFLMPKGWDRGLGEFFLNTLKGFFGLGSQPFLAVNSLYLGITAAGVAIVKLLDSVAKSDLDFPMVTAHPGFNLDKAVWSMETAANQFPTFLLVGYPSFLKMWVRTLKQRGFPFEKKTVHILTGAEYISENLRQELQETCGGRVLSLYMAADTGGLLGMESNFTIILRQLAARDHMVRGALYPGSIPQFGTSVGDPGIFQVPPTVYLESLAEEDPFGSGHARELLITNRSVIRYRIGDLGFIRKDPFEVLQHLGGKGVGVASSVGKITPLPLVFLYGKETGAPVGGAKLHVHMITEALDEEPLAGLTTSDFWMESKENELTITISLAQGREADQALEALFWEILTDRIRKKSPEFAAVWEAFSGSPPLKIRLLPRGDPAGPYQSNLRRMKPSPTS